MGSAPGDRTKIIGVVQVESAKDPFKSNSGEYVKRSPRFSPTNFLISSINFSSVKSFINNNFWKAFNFLSNAAGNFSSQGFLEFMIVLNVSYSFSSFMLFGYSRKIDDSLERAIAYL